MALRKCRYWVLIRQYKRKDYAKYGYGLHELRYEIRWSSGWSGVPKYKNIIQKHGPFPTRADMLNFYFSNKASFLGGLNAKVLDMADVGGRGWCEDEP